MKEIRCQKCNHCLAKGVEIGCGFFYLNPSRKLIMFKEEIKCPSCNTINEITVGVAATMKIKIIDNPRVEK